MAGTLNGASIKTASEIEAMRTGGKMLAQVLAFVGSEMAAGMTTDELDQLAASEVKRLGGEAAFLGHEGFPKSICISVNDEVVHGIPGSRVLQTGDVVGLDFGVRYDGLVTDSAVTLPIGSMKAPARRLLNATEAALMIGIDQATAGSRVGDISSAIQRHLQTANLGIIRELAGHGVGRELWEEPQIPNYGRAGAGPVLKAGMTVAIEPMATLGSPEITILGDKWTIAARDGSLAAQFEHTILITNGAPEILTLA
ncbi:MAG TPA: type I methionyl aminopeptidase [Candidatus Saccharimonadia bacterium]